MIRGKKGGFAFDTVGAGGETIGLVSRTVRIRLWQ